MAEPVSLASLLAKFAGPVGTLLGALIKPRVEAWNQKREKDKKLDEFSTLQGFGNYLVRAYEKNSYLQTLVFQNQKKKLDDLYVPLTVKIVENKGERRIRVDSYPPELVPRYEKVLIVDTAGMGKSTLARFLFLDCLRQSAAIPILIELRQLSESRGVIDVLTDEVNPLVPEISGGLLRELISNGGFLFIFDGYDEIPLEGRQTVSRELQEFISRAAHGNQFVLTSREDAALAAFANFQRFSIEPLNIGEAFDLIRKYDSEGELSKRIISKLETEATEGIKEFLTNPMLVSLLYKSYDFKPTLPQRKHLFYRQVYDALFECHDLTKTGHFIREKHSKLDLDDFHRVLRILGFLTLRVGKVEYDRDELLKYIEDARVRCPPLLFQAGDFLRDLTSTVPLFAHEGHYFRWAHKSLQEYFAAQFICTDTKGKQESLLRSIAKMPGNDQYRHVLELCYDIDYRTFRNSVVRDLIVSFLDHYDRLLVNLPNIERQDVDLRKQVIFGRRLLFLREKDTRLANFFHSSVTATENDIRALFPNENFSFLTLFAPGASGERLVLAVFNSPIYELVEVLHRRRDPLVEDLHLPIAARKDVDLSPMDDLLGMVPSEINWDGEHPLNRPEDFAGTNRLLRLIIRFALAPSACRSALREIDEDLKRDSECELLSDL